MSYIDHAALASEYIDLQARAEQIKDRLDEIKTLFATSLETRAHDFDGVKVTVSPNRRLDTKKIQEAYPVHQHPTFYRTTPDTTAIKKELGENEYARYCTEGMPRVSVKDAA